MVVLSFAQGKPSETVGRKTNGANVLRRLGRPGCQKKLGLAALRGSNDCGPRKGRRGFFYFEPVTFTPRPSAETSLMFQTNQFQPITP